MSDEVISGGKAAKSIAISVSHSFYLSEFGFWLRDRAGA
jgi:hypothetical protein